MKSSKVFYLHKFKSIITSRLFLLDVFVFLFGTAFSFFTKTKFFSPAGTSSLTVYFTSAVYVSVIVIPAIFLRKESGYDDFVPLSNLKKIVLDYFAKLSSFILLVILFLWMPFFVSFYGDVDFGSVLVGFFLLVFYGAAGGALCLFFSELFQKSISAFAFSVLSLFVLSFCHWLALYFSVPSFVSKILYFVSFISRFDSSTKGILSLGDFVYFSSFSFLFIFFSFLLRENKKGKVWKFDFRLRFFLLFAICVFLSLDFYRFDYTFDFSEDKLYSVTDYSRKILSETNQTVVIHFYKSGKLESIYPLVRNVSDFLRQYEKNCKNISLKVIDCDKDEKARNLLNSYGIYPQRIKTENSTSTEFIDVYSSVVLESGDNVNVIPFVLSPVSLEYQLDVKLLKLVYGIDIKVNVLAGNGQSLDDELRLFNDWFSNQDISVNQIWTDQLETVTGPLFVIGEEYFDRNDSLLIQNYLESEKGNVLFCTSPFSVDVQGDWSVSEKQNHFVSDMLYDYGITFKPSFVMDYSCQRISMMSEDSSRDYAEILNYPFWVNVLPQTNSKTGFTMFWPTSLELSGFAEPFIVSSSHSYEKDFDFTLDDLYIDTNPFTVKLQNVQTNALQNHIIGACGNIKSAKSTYNVSTKGCFYLIPDENFPSYYTNGFIGGETGDFRNFMFLTNLFWKLNGKPEIAELQSKTVMDRSLYKRNRGKIH